MRVSRIWLFWCFLVVIVFLVNLVFLADWMFLIDLVFTVDLVVLLDSVFFVCGFRGLGGFGAFGGCGGGGAAVEEEEPTDSVFFPKEAYGFADRVRPATAPLDAYGFFPGADIIYNFLKNYY